MTAGFMAAPSTTPAGRLVAGRGEIPQWYQAAHRANALGMDFGLWLEPEMVNPDSELYRATPDWVIHFPRQVLGDAATKPS